MAEDALVAKRINKGPGKKQPKMYDGWYIDKYEEKHNQEIGFLDNYLVKKLRGKPKGIKQVLEKCQLRPGEE
ncbi:10904_t:CDS:1, partial [Cetraspora pellucida]